MDCISAAPKWPAVAGLRHFDRECVKQCVNSDEGVDPCVLFALVLQEIRLEPVEEEVLESKSVGVDGLFCCVAAVTTLCHSGLTWRSITEREATLIITAQRLS